MVDAKKLIRALLLAVCAIFQVQPATAQTLRECAVDRITVIETANGESKLIADYVAREGNLFKLRGNSTFRAGDEQFAADEIDYQQDTGTLDVRGNAKYVRQGRLEVQADNLRAVGQESSFRAENTKFRIGATDINLSEGVPVGFRGKADVFAVEPTGQIVMKGVSITNCPEGETGIYIESGDIVMMLETGRGVAKNAVIKFGDTPILVLPRFWFPITEDRLSGFLYPTIGDNKRHGTFVEVPYYLNLAPNYDATATFTGMSKRGLQLGLEFRHLSEHSEMETYFEALPSDEDFDNKDRSALRLDYSWNKGPWYANLESKVVSDLHYLSHFHDHFGGRSDKYLRQDADIHYLGNTFLLSSGVTRYLASNPSVKENIPYDRTPWAKFDQTLPITEHVSVATKLGFDQFRRENANHGKRYGGNLFVNSSFGNSFGHLSFGAGVNYVAYNDAKVDGKESANESKSIPYHVIEGQLILDQVADESSQRHWSLVPRFKYIDIKKVDQMDLPVFDASVRRIENFEDLFAINRYVGGDRFGNARQVTVGLSANLIDGETKERRVGFDIGQIFYSQDRYPTTKCKADADDMICMPPKERMVANDRRQTSSKSDLYIGMNAVINHEWSTTATMMLDDEDSSQVNQSSLGLVRKSDKLSHRTMYRDVDGTGPGDGRQVGNSLMWKVDSSWSVDARHLYSLEDDLTLETEVLVSRESCCYTVGMEFTRDLDAQYRNRSEVSLVFAILGYGFQ